MAAVSLAEFSNIMRKLSMPLASRIGVAVSGGPDSMALTHLMSLWHRQRMQAYKSGIDIAQQSFARTTDAAQNKPSLEPYLLAVTVDHNLRPESAEEAHKTSRMVKELGVEHEIHTLTWNTKPTTGTLLGQARDKRYLALLDICLKHNLEMVMTAHQLEDRIETMLFRLCWCSSIPGLASIQPISNFPMLAQIPKGISLVRPLLELPKERLIATCKEQKIDFIDDPTNKVTVFQRNRIRMLMKDLDAKDPEYPLSVKNLERFCNSMQEHRNVMEERMVKYMERNVRMDETRCYATVRLDRTFTQETALVTRVLNHIACKLSPIPGPKRQTALERAQAKIVSFLEDGPRREQGFKTNTAAGCIFTICPAVDTPEGIIRASKRMRNQKLHLYIGREPIGFTGVKRLTQEINLSSTGEASMLWDNRLWITVKTSPALRINGKLVIRPMNVDDLAYMRRSHFSFFRTAARKFSELIPDELRFSEPIIANGDRILAAPTLGFAGVPNINVVSQLASADDSMEGEAEEVME